MEINNTTFIAKKMIGSGFLLPKDVSFMFNINLSQCKKAFYKMSDYDYIDYESKKEGRHVFISVKAVFDLGYQSKEYSFFRLAIFGEPL